MGSGILQLVDNDLKTLVRLKGSLLKFFLSTSMNVGNEIEKKNGNTI